MIQKLCNQLPNIVVTAGEPAGIGLDICALLVKNNLPKISANLIIIADKFALQARAKLLGFHIDLPDYNPASNTDFSIIHVPTNSQVIAGKLNPANSIYVLDTIKIAADGCLNQAFDAMVTGPIHKGVVNDAGIVFTGHTEFLADYTQTAQVVMMLVGGEMRVALATTHLPLKDVPAAITKSSLETTIRILYTDLITKFGIANPCVLVAGLNPHAGEDGYLGLEEIETINPVLAKLRHEGMHLIGALPADTLFAKHNLAEADAVLAMYHDQGLPVLKHASFGGGVNLTLGLPIIRTSVDHGTALNLAGKGSISIGSMMAAIELAIQLANNKKKQYFV